MLKPGKLYKLQTDLYIKDTKTSSKDDIFMYVKNIPISIMPGRGMFSDHHLLNDKGKITIVGCSAMQFEEWFEKIQ